MDPLVNSVQLYMAPGTCARVPTICLEEAGQDFESVVVRFMKGEHKSPDYKKLNPKGKVPTLVIDGQVLTENVAIIIYLNERFPDAKLLPATTDSISRARQLADLSFCSATLHPIVTRIRMPNFFAAKDAAQSVWEKGCEAMTEFFRLIDDRLTGQDWWYGDQWSAMDAYLYWVFWRVEGADFDVTPYPSFKAHAARMEERPAVQRALQRESEATETLKNEGLLFTPPTRHKPIKSSTDDKRKRPPPRTLEVLSKRFLTPHMIRVTLGGPGLEGFPEDSGGGYVKLRLAEPDSDDGKPLVRTYTVRHHDAATGTLDVDFVVHDTDGPAVNWAQNCKPGDTIKVGGPGPKKPLDPDADWYLMVGDMSALPAISANVERMASDAKGYALLEVICEEDIQELDFPRDVQVEWIVNSEPERENTVLLDRVKALDWLPGNPYVWVAGEFSQSLAIRSLMKSSRSVDRKSMYASSYWQIGQTEDGHKISKREVASE